MRCLTKTDALESAQLVLDVALALKDWYQNRAMAELVLPEHSEPARAIESWVKSRLTKPPAGWRASDSKGGELFRWGLSAEPLVVKYQGVSIYCSASHIGSDHPLFDREITIKVARRHSYLLEAILDEALREYTVSLNGKIRACTNSYTEWVSVAPVDIRDSSTLVLANGLYEEIENDYRTFLSSRKIYARLGIPYHRGYLLYGPPGTGKSSTAMVLAGKFHKKLHLLSLSSISSGHEQALLSSIPSDSIVLIDDIDRFDPNPMDGISITELLAILDCVYTPPGVLFIATCNSIEELPEPLTRPGRMDRLFELQNLTSEQVTRIHKQIMGTDPTPSFVKGYTSHSPADAVEALRAMLIDRENKKC